MNGAAIPSLAVIGAIGAHRSGFLGASRSLVISTSVPRDKGGATFAHSSGMLNDQSADFGSIARWAGGVALLAGCAFAFGDGPIGDVAGAFLALTAFGMTITYGGDVIGALTESITPGPSTHDTSKSTPVGTAVNPPLYNGGSPTSSVPGFWGSFGVGGP